MTEVGTDEISARSGHQPELEATSIPFHERDIIGRKYEVVRPLSVGGVAFAVAARNLELDEMVVLKVLRPECLADASLVARFDQEARASIDIKSEHVARVFEVGSMPDGAPFLVMEYVEGEHLGALLREAGTAPLHCASEFVLQACDALAAAHSIGIVHRDIKPENLFLARRKQGLDVIKLLDFGISKLALTSSVVDSSGPRANAITSTATPNYMSPEQVRAWVDIDGRSDIWSLGCVLHELLTGHAPFEAPSITVLTAMILEQPAPPLRERRRDLPPEIEAVYARCLEKDPDLRFQNVFELATALYPFAPRRARLSIEHCSYISKNAGREPTPLKLSSAPPPGRARPKTTIPPRKPSAPPNSGHPNTAMTLPIGDGTNGELEDIDVLLATSAMRGRPKMWKVAGVCLLLAAGAYALHASHVPALLMGTASVATAAVGAAPLPTVTAPAAATAGSAPTPSALDVEVSKTTSPAAAATPKTEPSASPPRKSRPKSHHPTNSTEEIDVGF